MGEMVVCLGDEDPDEVDAVRISVFSFYRSKLLRLRRRTRGYANSFDFWAHQTPRLRDPRKKLRRSSTCWRRASPNAVVGLSSRLGEYFLAMLS